MGLRILGGNGGEDRSAKRGLGSGGRGDQIEGGVRRSGKGGELLREQTSSQHSRQRLPAKASFAAGAGGGEDDRIRPGMRKMRKSDRVIKHNWRAAIFRR